MNRPRMSLEEARALWRASGTQVEVRVPEFITTPCGDPVGMGLEVEHATLAVAPELLGYTREELEG